MYDLRGITQRTTRGEQRRATLNRRISISRSLKNQKATDAYTREANKRIIELRKCPILSADKLLHDLLTALEETALKHLPKMRSSAKQEEARERNMVGFNTEVRPLRKVVDRCYAEWKNSRGSGTSSVIRKRKIWGGGTNDTI